MYASTSVYVHAESREKDNYNIVETFRVSNRNGLGVWKHWINICKDKHVYLMIVQHLLFK